MTVALRIRIALVTVVALALAGCATQQQTTTPPRAPETPVAPITNTDACATRLQDVCGGVLLFYQVNGRLPDTLGEVKQFPGGESAGAFVCPVSRLAYVYVPNGIYLPEKKAYVVLYDAAPSHSNLRWAVQIDEPQEGKPLVTKVIALPESFFLLRR